jgi:thiol-disulfide isomerase/thioredoxin
MIVFAAYATMIPIGRFASPLDSVAHAQIQTAAKVGELAPDIAFTTVDGAEHRLSEFQGRPVMLWFYASWCPTCQVGTMAVAGIVDQLKLAGVQIIQLQLYKNLGYPGPTVEEFATQYASSVPRSSNWLWGDASLVASYTYDPQGYPDIYFLIDENGTLRAMDFAPHVTMDKILKFAQAANRGG